MRVDTGGCLDPDDVAAFLHARLEPASLRAMEQHVTDCRACRRLLSALSQGEMPPRSATARPAADAALLSTVPLGDQPALDLAPGAAIGRYVVAGCLGAGAMGAVYAAYDPALDRRIALKILRDRALDSGGQERMRDRLRCEAQAMAQLAHPNVVAVHDVGTVDGHIFIAMELVEGQTLAAWLAERRRRWRAVVAMFVPAGQGLAAAHSAGLVHRDFKAENVLVGSDGRIRVGDFGLAQMLAPGARASEEPAPGTDLAAVDRSTTVLAGTPYYMAPEQFRCQPCDARSDQFSFCVALYSAIAGEHPFDGDGIERLADAVMHGRRRRPPPRSTMPGWLLRVLVRGTAVDPADRHPGMAELLAALGRDPRRRRAGVAIAAVVAGLVAAVAVFAHGDAPALCRGADRKWAGIWDPARAAAVERAFSATHKPYAAAAYRTVSDALSGYRTGWIAMHTETCEATRVRGEQSEDLLQRRMLCLDGRLHDAGALVERFAAADADTVEHAAAAVGSLGDLAGCADARALSSEVPPPADRATAARVAELRGELARLKALRVAGHERDGRDAIGALVASAAATHYRPLEAEARFEQGAIARACADSAEAARAYEDAVWAAEAGRDDKLVAGAWLELMNVRRSEARFSEALALTPRVTAVLERLGGNDELEGELHIVRSSVMIDVGTLPAAQHEAELARTLLERRFGPGDLHVADAHDRLGEVAARMGRTDDSIAEFQRALAIKQRVLGADHPATASVLRDVAREEEQLGHYDKALTMLATVQAVYERAYDANHRQLAIVAHDIGLAHEALEHFDQAAAMYRRALSIGAVALGKDHPDYATFLMDLGDALEGESRHDEALATLQEALPILERHLGPHHVRVGVCLEFIARVEFGRDRLREARSAIQRALEVYAHSAAGDSDARQALLLLGFIELGLGAPARAIPPLERAYALGADTDAAVYAETQWALGRALVETGRDRARGMTLVQAAYDEFARDRREADHLRELVAWRRRHR